MSSSFWKKCVTGALAAAIVMTGVGSLGGCGGKTAVNRQKNILEDIRIGLEAPEGVLDVVNVSKTDSTENILCARILQGVVNKQKPRVYLAPESDEVQDVRFSLLGTYGDVDTQELTLDAAQSHRSFATFWTVFEKYADEIENIYIFDSDLSVSDSINVAAMLAGRNRGVAVNRTIYKSIVSEGYAKGKKVIDVCETYGFTATKGNYGINAWIEQNMIEGSNRDFGFVLSTSPRDEGSTNYPSVYDLAVATDSIIYHFMPDFDLHKKLQKKILDHFDDNFLVIGWPGIEVEGIYIKSVSECNKEAVCCDWGFANGSIYASFPSFRQETALRSPKDDVKVKSDKVYVSFTVSDGDAWHYAERDLIRFWNEPVRGMQPIGWTIPTLFAEFNPLLLEYLYDTAYESDELAQGVTGIGYVQPKFMSDSAYTQFCYDTKNSLSSVGLNAVNFWDVGADCYTLTSPRLKEFCDVVKPAALYLGHAEMTNDYFMVGDTVCMNSMGCDYVRGTRTADEVVAAVDRAIEHTPSGPVFANINIEAWGEGVSTVQQAADILTLREDGYKYEFMLPAEMADAIRSYVKHGDDGEMPEDEKVTLQSASFKPFTAAEEPYLYEDFKSNTNPQLGNRYADADAYWIYEFGLSDKTSFCQVGMQLANEYVVSISATPNGPYKQALRNLARKDVYGTIDAVKLLGESYNGTFYLKFEDAVKSDGFGISLTELTVRYR